MLNIRLATENRKAAAERLAEITGAESHYTRVPRCAYEVGLYTIEKDGSITVAEGTDLQPLHALVKEGLVEPFEAVAPETPPEELTPDADEDETAQEPVELTVSMPLTRHTGATLRNLLNLVYTRSSLLNKALGTSFRVEPGLTDALQDDACILTVESLLTAISAYEDEHGKALGGITITPEEISFTSLPETTEPERLRAFTELVAMMNKQAIDQKRVQAKAVNEENEKYALRIWLTRLGMNGPEFKTTRKVLMENLTGHSAFRTPAEEAKWKARQAEKREALKAAKEAAADENPET